MQQHTSVAYFKIGTLLATYLQYKLSTHRVEDGGVRILLPHTEIIGVRVQIGINEYGHGICHNPHCTILVDLKVRIIK